MIKRIARPAARILLLDQANRILLFRFNPPDRPPFWCTPGGAVDPGESYYDAARRELFEETGIVADPGPEVLQRQVEFLTLEGVNVSADERYFRVRLPEGADPQAIETSGHTELEQQVMQSWRWFDRDALAELDEPFFPEDLAQMMD